MRTQVTEQRRKPSKLFDANTTLPEGLTKYLIDEIQKLPDCPAVVYLKDQFLTKFVSSETDSPEVRRQRAINKWLAVERNNEATNVRLILTHEEYNILPRVTWRSFVRKAQEIVLGILGEVVPEEALLGGFSGGATTSRKRTESHPASKYLGKADITSAAQGWFETCLELCPGWAWHRSGFDANLYTGQPATEVRVVPGNVMFTVAKNAEIDRCCCKEPDLNMFLQKGAGEYIRKSLRKVGIDLNDQSINQKYAREGSVTGRLATLDLSSASDSVSIGIVELLLPPLWFSFLSDLRSPVTIIDGEEHCNEMFSSMGNGFTFELESLLFYAIARTVAYFRGVSGVVSIYGDDIICPTDIAEDLTWVLDYCGFEVNTSKSFWTGQFRESCGGHYINGHDVTPFYLRTPLTKMTDLIKVCNSIRKWAGQSGLGVLDPRVKHIWDNLMSYVPRNLRGGYDTSSITQLVSLDDPKHRLMPINGKPRSTGVGGLLLWLNVNSDVAPDSGLPAERVQTKFDWRQVVNAVRPDSRMSKLAEAGTRYRLRPALPDRSLGRILFVEELTCPRITLS